MRRHRLVIDPAKPEQCEKSTPPTHEIIRKIHRQIICDTTAVIGGGMLIAGLERRPDILVDGDAKVMAVRGEDGELWLSTRQRGRFVSDVWLRRDGQAETPTWPRDGEGAPGCRPSLRHARVHSAARGENHRVRARSARFRRRLQPRRSRRQHRPGLGPLPRSRDGGGPIRPLARRQPHHMARAGRGPCGKRG